MTRSGGWSSLPVHPPQDEKARSMPAVFSERCDTIEECYEFMLAYAGQGLPSDAGSQAGGQLREFLGRAVQALTGIGESCAVAAQNQAPAEKFEAFIAVLDRDARNSLAALELVLAQSVISSQLI